MINALINYTYLLGNVARFFARLRLIVAYALINQHIGSLFSRPSQNQILMVEKGAFLVSKRTNLYVGVQPSTNQVVVHVMRKKQATDHAMHRFLSQTAGQQMHRSNEAGIGFA